MYSETFLTLSRFPPLLPTYMRMRMRMRCMYMHNDANEGALIN